MSTTIASARAPFDPLQSEQGISAADAGAALMHAQAQFESEKGSLVRVLHDDLGGLLVGAAMDIGWLSQQPHMPAQLTDKLARVSALLRAAIDLKRTLIEEIQPTLLQNVGLLATLRWLMKRTCHAAGVAYGETYPAEEISLGNATKVTLYRLIQESLDFMLADGGVSFLSIELQQSGSELHCALASEQPYDPSDRTHASEKLFNTAMYYRALHVGGRFVMTAKPLTRHVEIFVPVPGAAL